LPDGLFRSFVFGVLVVPSDFADDDFGLERNRLQDDVVAVARLVRERRTDREPKFDCGIMAP
jgi:hypothetical protein